MTLTPNLLPSVLVFIAVAACTASSSGSVDISPDDVESAEDIGTDTVDTHLEDAEPLAFDPSSCESTESSSFLLVAGLDDGQLAASSMSTIRPSGDYSDVEEVLGSLAFPGPDLHFIKAFEAGPLQLWTAAPNDFGAIAWIDSRAVEVVFSGTVVRAAGAGITNPSGESDDVLVGGPPDTEPPYVVAPNPYWTKTALNDAVFELAARTEVVARYSACGDTTIVAYIYTPVVGLVDEHAARGLVLVSGHRATQRFSN